MNRMDSFDVDLRWNEVFTRAELISGRATAIRSLEAVNVRGGPRSWLLMGARADDRLLGRARLENVPLGGTGIVDAAFSLLPCDLSAGAHLCRLEVRFPGGSAEQSHPVEVLPDDHICLRLNQVDLLAAHVPTTGGALSDFADSVTAGVDSRDRVAVLCALYEGLRARRLPYQPVARLTRGDYQRVRSAASTLRYGGSCADLSLLFAGLCYLKGLSPVLAMFRDHMMAGAWLADPPRTAAILDAPDLARELTDAGALLLLDVVRLCEGDGVEQAMESARARLVSGEPMALTDVCAALRSGIRSVRQDALDESPEKFPTNPDRPTAPEPENHGEDPISFGDHPAETTPGIGTGAAATTMGTNEYTGEYTASETGVCPAVESETRISDLISSGDRPVTTTTEASIHGNDPIPFGDHPAENTPGTGGHPTSGIGIRGVDQNFPANHPVENMTGIGTGAAETTADIGGHPTPGASIRGTDQNFSGDHPAETTPEPGGHIASGIGIRDTDQNPSDTHSAATSRPVAALVCDNCGYDRFLPEQLRGGAVRCPSCERLLTVPDFLLKPTEASSNPRGNSSAPQHLSDERPLTVPDFLPKPSETPSNPRGNSSAPQRLSGETARCRLVGDRAAAVGAPSGAEVVRVPEVCQGRPVTEVSARAFDGCRMTAVELPACLTVVGDYAFRRCGHLTEIDLPEGLTALGTGAFSGCGALTAARIPGTLGRVPRMAFARCAALERVDIAEGVEEIDERAFEGCVALTTVTLPSTLLRVRADAFADCPRLTDVRLSSCATQLDPRAFAGSGVDAR